jgi:hypothetical protein
MECFHGIVSLDHEIEGELTINGREIDFTGGRGYTEKDWGRSFPEAWVWLQSNHLSEPGTSVVGSIAVIPWIRNAFLGFIVGIWHDGVLYRFANYTGAKIKHLDVASDSVTWVVADKNHVVEVHAVRSEGVMLHAPSVVGMNRQISESLDSRIEIKLSRITKSGEELLFHDTGRNAGMEADGNLDRLMSMWEATD